MFRGRPAKQRTIGKVRELSREDLEGLERVALPAVAKLKESHHAMARLVALGLRDDEVAVRSGYCTQTVRNFKNNNPAFQGLVAELQGKQDAKVVEVNDEFATTITYNRNIAARLLNEKLLEATHDQFTAKDLQAIIGDNADRTGYGKRTTVAHVDLTIALERARASRQRVIDLRPEPRLIGGSSGQGSD
jgi:hypothetical protein